MNEAEVQRVVESTVKRTVPDVLTRLGLDMSTPEAVIQAQVDFAYLRRARRGSEDVRKWATRSAVGVAASATLYALWEGFKHTVQAKLGGG